MLGGERGNLLRAGTNHADTVVAGLGLQALRIQGIGQGIRLGGAHPDPARRPAKQFWERGMGDEAASVDDEHRGGDLRHLG